MFDDLIEKIKQSKQQIEQKKIEKERNKPRYEISQLYVGKIGLYKYSKDHGFGETEWFFKRAKHYAIFVKIGSSKYLHIKSNQELFDIKSSAAIKGDYTAVDVQPFYERFPVVMRKYNLDLSTKVSVATIETLEDSMNQKLAPDEPVVELFK